MNMDTTIKGYQLNEDSLPKAIGDICYIDLDDDVTFTFGKVEPIRESHEYGGYRVNITSVFDTIVTPMQIDITTGDVITPNEKTGRYTFVHNK